jgi:hypothetical protein
MATILLISPYWKEDHRWMVSTVKLAELWQRMGYNVVVACMGASPMCGSSSPWDSNRERDTWVHPPSQDRAGDACVVFAVRAW